MNRDYKTPIGISFLFSCFLLAFIAPDTVSAQPRGQHATENLRDSYRTDYALTENPEQIRRYIKDVVKPGYDPDSAARILLNAYRSSFALQYTEGMLLALSELAFLERERGNFELAESYFRQLVFRVRQSGRTEKLPAVYNAIGKMYAQQGNYKLAIRLYYKAIQLAENHDPPIPSDYIYNNLGLSFTQLGRSSDLTMSYLYKAETEALAQKNHQLLGSVLINKGIAFNAEKLWDSSRVYFRQALNHANLHDLTNIRHAALTNIGMTYLEEDQPDRAIPFLKKAEAENPQVSAFLRNLNTYTLGSAYFLQKRYGESETLLLQSLAHAERMNQSLLSREILLNLGRLYGARGEFDKAYANLSSYINLNNRLSGSDVKKEVNSLEVRYRTAKKDREIAEGKLLIAQQEKKLGRKNMLILAVSSGSAILLLLLLFIYRNYRQNRRIQAHRIMLLHKEHDLFQKSREIDRLKAMIEGEELERIRIGRELHDGIGGLLSAAKIHFSSLGRRHRLPEEFNHTLSLLDEATSELRKTAHNLMPEILIQKGLPEAVHTFCERVSRGQQIRIHVQHFGEIPRMESGFELAVYRIIQELVHNIVKHAAATEALIQLNWQKATFLIVVEDNGQGMDHCAEKLSSGIGLGNIYHRVRTMNGEMDIESSPGTGTTVCIELPHETLLQKASVTATRASSPGPAA